MTGPAARPPRPRRGGAAGGAGGRRASWPRSGADDPTAELRRYPGRPSSPRPSWPRASARRCSPRARVIVLQAAHEVGKDLAAADRRAGRRPGGGRRARRACTRAGARNKALADALRKRRRRRHHLQQDHPLRGAGRLRARRGPPGRRPDRARPPSGCSSRPSAPTCGSWRPPPASWSPTPAARSTSRRCAATTGAGPRRPGFAVADKVVAGDRAGRAGGAALGAAARGAAGAGRRRAGRRGAHAGQGRVGRAAATRNRLAGALGMPPWKVRKAQSAGARPGARRRWPRRSPRRPRSTPTSRARPPTPATPWNARCCGSARPASPRVNGAPRDDGPRQAEDGRRRARPSPTCGWRPGSCG